MIPIIAIQSAYHSVVEPVTGRVGEVLGLGSASPDQLNPISIRVQSEGNILLY